MIPAYEVRRQKLIGSDHVKHSLHVGGVLIREQISPFSDAEIADLVRSHLNPPAHVANRPPEFNPGARSKAYSVKGGRKKKVTETGFKWTEPEELE